jgi:hypothetical protein
MDTEEKIFPVNSGKCPERKRKTIYIYIYTYLCALLCVRGLAGAVQITSA